MKYYLYLDTEMLQTLVSDTILSNFDIDIMEVSIIEGETIANNFNINPTIDNRRVCNGNMNKENKSKENISKGNRKEDYSKLEFTNGKVVTKNKTKERKFINIQDMEKIENIRFYNKLLLKLEKDNNSKIYLEKGIIKIYKLKEICKTDKENMFFLINNSYVWIEKEYLKSDLIVIASIKAEVNILGYLISEENDYKILKAIAIYI